MHHFDTHGLAQLCSNRKATLTILLWINIALCHFMWDCYPVHMLREEELLQELWAPGGSHSFSSGSSGLGNPPAPHWRAVLCIVPAPELLTSETEFLLSLGSNEQQLIAVFHTLFCSWPLDPATLINSIRRKRITEQRKSRQAVLSYPVSGWVTHPEVSLFSSSRCEITLWKTSGVTFSAQIFKCLGSWGTAWIPINAKNYCQIRKNKSSSSHWKSCSIFQVMGTVCNSRF